MQLQQMLANAASLKQRPKVRTGLTVTALAGLTETQLPPCKASAGMPPAHLHVLGVARVCDVCCCARDAAAHLPHQLAGRVVGRQQLTLLCRAGLDLLLAPDPVSSGRKGAGTAQNGAVSHRALAFMLVLNSMCVSRDGSAAAVQKKAAIMPHVCCHCRHCTCSNASMPSRVSMPVETSMLCLQSRQS